LQDQDIDPALVVTGHDIGVLHVETLEAFDIPLGIAHQLHPEFVGGNPELGSHMHG